MSGGAKQGNISFASFSNFVIFLACLYAHVLFVVDWHSMIRSELTSQIIVGFLVSFRCEISTLRRKVGVKGDE